MAMGVEGGAFSLGSLNQVAAQQEQRTSQPEVTLLPPSVCLAYDSVT